MLLDVGWNGAPGLQDVVSQQVGRETQTVEVQVQQVKRKAVAVGCAEGRRMGLQPHLPDLHHKQRDNRVVRDVEVMVEQYKVTLERVEQVRLLIAVRSGCGGTQLLKVCKTRKLHFREVLHGRRQGPIATVIRLMQQMKHQSVVQVRLTESPHHHLTYTGCKHIQMRGFMP